jgi:hypothetical protein
MKYLITIALWISLLSTPLFAEEAKVVKLHPPIITSQSIGVEYACNRPGHDEGLNISVEKRGDKTIVNCYGHGGAGWTTLFGSVEAAIERFKKLNLPKDIPIRVLGSGCMGLTTAIELSRLGYKVEGIYTKSLYDMPSWRAAGFFGLLVIKSKTSILPIAKASFLAYQQIANGQHPYLSKSGVKLLPIYCTPDAEEEIAFLAEMGLIPPKKPVTLDFQNGVTHSGFFEYMTFFMNTGVLMKELIAEVKKRHIPLEINPIEHYADVKEKIVFNCTSAGARQLNNDKKVNEIRGHLIGLNKKSGKGHMDYILLTSVMQDNKLQTLYMTPKSLIVTPENPAGIKSLGVIGTTFIEHAEKFSPEQVKELDEQEFQKLLERASLFFSGQPFGR